MDHETVNCSVLPISCGVMGLSRYDSDVEKVCYAIGTRLYHPSRGDPVAFLIWSDMLVGAGAVLAEFIDKNKLGDIVVASATENPKTGNFITVWTCMIYHTQWKKWWVAKRQAKLGKAGT